MELLLLQRLLHGLSRLLAELVLLEVVTRVDVQVCELLALLLELLLQLRHGRGGEEPRPERGLRRGRPAPSRRERARGRRVYLDLFFTNLLV